MKDNRDSFLLDEQREQHAAQNAAAREWGAMANGMRDLRHVTWPEVEYYGHDHGKQTSRLVLHVAQTMSEEPGASATLFSKDDLHVIKAVGYFHDIGRQVGWPHADPGHHERSAELAGKAMAADSENWVPAHLRNEVCRVILAHGVSEDGPRPTDPRMIALHDAECLEAARFAPNTPEGLTFMGRRFARLITPWARNRDVQARWKRHRGWA